MEEAQAIFVETVKQKVGERRGAQSCLIGAASEADCAGPHGETACTNVGVSEDYFILSGELLRQRIWLEQRGSSNGGFREKCCAQGPGGSAKEISPQHGAVSLPIPYADSGRRKSYSNEEVWRLA